MWKNYINSDIDNSFKFNFLLWNWVYTPVQSQNNILNYQLPHQYVSNSPNTFPQEALGVKSSNVHKSSPMTRSYPGQTFRHNRIAHGLELQVPITRVVGSSLRKFPACWFLPRFAVIKPLPVLLLSIFGFRGTIS